MIDAHHHIWRQTDLPWLLGPEQPRIFGPYAAIKRDYLIGEFRGDVAGTGIEKSVYVQANWAPDRAADEAAWVQQTADENGWPHAIVGFVDFTVPDVRPQLDILSAYPLMRGIRQQLHWHQNPLYRFAKRPDLATDPVVQTNIARLADYGWCFDLQLFAAQMADGAALAAACPDVTFVLQHAGMLEDRSQTGRETWRTGLKALAAQPNVVTKLSAFGTFIHMNDPAHITDMITETVGIFGAGRCLFGSNFPIEKIWTSYAELLAAFLAATETLPEPDRTAIFSGTARHVYRLS
ncbi:MAG: amidohydrolase family protein [Pseudomonadota bacterium]